MQVYRVEVMVADHHELGEKGIRSAIENGRYPNSCLLPHVASMEARNIGEWEDSHPLNIRDRWLEEFRKLFPLGGQ